MIERIVTNALLSGWWFPIVWVTVTAFLCWKEFRRENGYRAIRIIAVLLVMGAIAGLFLRPSYRTARSNATVLLTDGYTTAQADSLLESNKDIRFYHLGDAHAYKNSTHLNSVNDLSPLADKINIVAGHGLPEHGWDQLKEAAPTFIPGAAPGGVTTLSIPYLWQNRRATIHGSFTTTDVPATISLQSPGGGEDSVTFTKAGTYPFDLSFTPRQAGRFIYQLAIRNTVQVEREDIPLVIREASPAKILFLQQQPSFETRYLKDYLSRHNHQVVLRYQLSKNIFRYEYAHHPAVTINSLSEKIANDFDLIILDEDMLASLPVSEVKVIDRAAERGLGVLILIASGTGKHTSHFFPWNFSPAKADTTKLLLDSKKITVSMATVTAPASTQLNPILKNKSGVLTGYRTIGLGKVGYQLLQDTYPLVLQGDSIAYSHIWSPSIEILLRSIRREQTVHIKNNFPFYPHTPLAVDIITTQNNPALSADSIVLPLAEDAIVDNLWHTTMWTATPGWHQFITGDSVKHNYYVSAPGAWKSLQAIHVRNASMLHRQSRTADDTTRSFTYRFVPPLLFYLLMLAGLLVLWLTPKL
jgi:hypothetical protein